MSVIGMFVAFTQVDFMLIRISADIIVNHFTTYWFLRGKKVDFLKYEMWKNGQEKPNNMQDVQFHTEDIELSTDVLPPDIQSPRPHVVPVSEANCKESDSLLIFSASKQSR